jgi:hypothetical protein
MPPRAPSLADLVAEFRSAETERTSSLVLVVDDAEVRRLLAAWESIPVPPWSRPRGKAPAELRDRWFWLWDGCGGLYHPPYALELAYAAQVPHQAALNKWRSAVTFRLAYPDGTIAEGARRALERFVENQLEPPRGRRAKPPAAAAEPTPDPEPAPSPPAPEE